VDYTRDYIERLIAERDAFFEEGIKSAKRHEAEVKRLTEERDAALARRGGECKVCGGWVCPPLTCYACQAGLSPDDALRKENQQLTARAEMAELRVEKLTKQGQLF